MILIVFLLFILGLAIGSFVNVVIYRAVHGDSPLRGRSYCDHCKAPIAWYDNIPLLSFLILRRRCRACKKSIPWEYPAVELITGTLFVWWYLVGFTFFQLTQEPLRIVQSLFWLSVGVLFVIIIVTDLLYMIIPDSTVFLLTILTMAYRMVLVLSGAMQQQDFVLAMVAAFASMLFFLFLVLGTKGQGMGLGDVKLVFPLGLLVGFPNMLVALMTAFVVGAIVGLVLLSIKRKKLKSTIPFGPFLILGAVVALLWGDIILRWYSSYL